MNALLIVNPAAGRGRLHEALAGALVELEKRGWRVTLTETRVKGDATRLAASAVAQGKEAVVVVGGDGTLNEAANGLAGSEVALGVLPVGTGNVWAAEIGLVPLPTPLHKPDLVASAARLADGVVRRIDLGRANGRHFLLWAGVGFDGRLTAAIEAEPRGRAMKRRMGPPAYLLLGLATALTYAGRRATVTADGHRLRRRVLLVLVGNSQLYAGAVRVTARARLDDGLLDVCVFEGKGFFHIFRHLVAIVAGRHLFNPHVAYIQARAVTIHAPRPLPVQVDGEPMGTTPVEIEAVPGALQVLMPVDARQELFSGPQGAPKTAGTRGR